jgi:hypothetical protein
MKRNSQSTQRNVDRPSKRQQCSHACEVTPERLFVERQKWQFACDVLQNQIDSLQNQIDILSTVGAAIVPPQAATVEESDQGKKQTMPSDHPLYEFIHRNFNKTDWDSRTPCGLARQRYNEHCTEAQEASGAKKKLTLLHHISFAKEMTKYFPRQGCSKRSYYVGLELIDRAQPAGEGSTL